MGFRRSCRGPPKKLLEHVSNVGILEFREVLPEQRVCGSRANSSWALGFALVHRGALVERHRQDWSGVKRVFLATGVQRASL